MSQRLTSFIDIPGDEEDIDLEAESNSGKRRRKKSNYEKVEKWAAALAQDEKEKARENSDATLDTPNTEWGELLQVWRRVKRERMHESVAFRVFEAYESTKRKILAEILKDTGCLLAVAATFIPRKLYDEESTPRTAFSYYTSASMEIQHENPLHLCEDRTNLLRALMTHLQDPKYKDLDIHDDDLVDYRLPTSQTEHLLLQLIRELLMLDTEDEENQVAQTKAQAFRDRIIEYLMELKVSPELIKAIYDNADLPEEFDDANSNIEHLLEQKSQIIQAHLYSVCFSAQFHVARGAKAKDCIQFGTLGLSRAVDKYSYESGHPFWKYCWPSISGAIARNIGKLDANIQIPQHIEAKLQNLRKATRLAAALYGDTSPKTIARIMEEELEKEISIEEIRELQRLEALRIAESSNNNFGSNDSEDYRSLEDTLAMATEDTPESLLLQKESDNGNNFEAILNKASLNVRERDILRKRLIEDMTLEEIGKLYNLTRERIRQIEIGAIRKLRNKMKT